MTNNNLEMSENIYDLIIVGGGPAGCSAAVYAARKQLKTLLVTKEWGGQSIVSDDIQNWIGTPHISGSDLAKNLRTHVEEYAGDFLTVHSGSFVKEVKNENEIITLTLEDSTIHTGKTMLIASGSARRKMEAINADVLEHKGVTYCASCDGPMFGDMDVVVIGGGNAGFESAAQLLAYCKSVTLLSRSEPRADAITVAKLVSNPKFKLITNATPKEVHGEKFLNGLTYTDIKTNTDVKLDVSGVFVEIGQIPATDWCKDIVERDEINKIKIDPWTQKTSAYNIWAAGDCTNILYHQNNIASGDAVKALEDIYLHLHT
jgi:alkyl hydroperoxide reductase subunit F